VSSATVDGRSELRRGPSGRGDQLEDERKDSGMKARRYAGRGLLIVVAALSLVLQTNPAGAAPLASDPVTAVAAIPPPPDRCWPSGTRIKSPSSPTVYLIGPEGIWHPIPDETTYFRLFTSWSGLVVSSDFTCFDLGNALSGARLVKTSSRPEVYLNYAGVYRWIPNETTFNYYHFAWSKIQIVSAIGVGGPAWIP
jgi:hypothetical protein